MKANRDIFRKGCYLTDGGLETSLIYQQGFELNHFAAFELLVTSEGRTALRNYYRPYLELAVKNETDFVLETPTWRANSDWGNRLGYTKEQLSEINKDSVYFLRDLAGEFFRGSEGFILSGNIGPRGDGYVADALMSPAKAKAYHQQQIHAFAYADVDVITAITLTNSSEAIGIINAAKYFGIPVVISFTVETDGMLPSGEELSQAIEKVDNQTSWYASHYMINCAHPQHFQHVLKDGGYWTSRIKGIRANASCKSHAELDACVTLDSGDKRELAEDYRELGKLLPDLRVIGGCCGTDHTHIEEIRKALFDEAA